VLLLVESLDKFIVTFSDQMKRLYDNRNENAQNKQAKSNPYLFNGGNCADWSLIKNEIIDKFRSEGVWDEYIKSDSPLLYSVDSEKLFTDPEPKRDEYVDTRTNQVLITNIAYAEMQRALIMTLPDTPDRASKLFDLAFDENREARNASRKVEDFEKEFSAHLVKWETKHHYHLKNVASCNKVFSESFAPGIRIAIKDYLAVGHFRRAWIEINTLYSPSRGGADAQLSYVNLLQSTIYNGGDLERHLVILNQYINDLSLIDVNLSDQSKVAYLLNSMIRSSNRDFHETVSFHHQSRSDYLTFCDALRLENNKLLFNRSIAKLDRSNQPQAQVARNNNNNNNYNQKKISITCSKCHKTGHSAAQCLVDVKCSFCNKPGHRKENCFFDPKSPKYKAEWTQRSNNTNSSSSSSGSSGATDQVSLASNFKKKNKKPVK
jgi:hypothetical protein